MVRGKQNNYKAKLSLAEFNKDRTQTKDFISYELSVLGNNAQTTDAILSSAIDHGADLVRETAANTWLRDTGEGLTLPQQVKFERPTGIVDKANTVLDMTKHFVEVISRYDELVEMLVQQHEDDATAMKGLLQSIPVDILRSGAEFTAFRQSKEQISLADELEEERTTAVLNVQSQIEELAELAIVGLGESSSSTIIRPSTPALTLQQNSTKSAQSQDGKKKSRNSFALSK
ncbi:ORF3 protein [Bondarzewia berkeleyi negative-strand RNA virus 1]|uniref:ORF3 protein n=1 Tax=Bondarzewia berkeleyi negative-strand RNA virus 1 TaxID=2768771 RepID=A0AAE7JKY2_9MONO|nr:ORF3 protein [Bondarzewia berkeleyi negative-strand RNA virus 1]QNQ73377.1 ORF3 protein [Bondarzewia berkeleyi negative-strand RNA virus 1]